MSCLQPPCHFPQLLHFPYILFHSPVDHQMPSNFSNLSNFTRSCHTHLPSCNPGFPPFPSHLTHTPNGSPIPRSPTFLTYLSSPHQPQYMVYCIPPHVPSLLARSSCCPLVFQPPDPVILYRFLNLFLVICLYFATCGFDPLPVFQPVLSSRFVCLFGLSSCCQLFGSVFGYQFGCSSLTTLTVQF